MTRTILAILVCSFLSYEQLAHAQTAPTTVTGTFRFTTPQIQQSLNEAVTIIRTVAAVPQVSVDAATAVLTFSGPADAVNFAEWILPQIDKVAGDETLHEYRLPSGDIGRVNFVSNVQRTQQMQELLTVLRTVADVQKIFNFTSNQAIVLRGPEWEIAFAEWIIDQINQPVRQQPDTTPREFMIGGPDFRGMGHGARINFVANMKSQLQIQELLTVLRTVGDVMKVFSYTSSPALVLRAGDTDLQRAEWIIQQLDLSAVQPPGAKAFTAPVGDDVTRIFYLRNTTPQWLHSAVTGIHSELNIKKIFSTTSPANIVVRGTTDQIASAVAWMTAHNALVE
jgi:hypothetical protein